MNRTPFPHEQSPNSLAAALRRLPDHTPDGDTWSRIRARAATRSRRRRRLRIGLPLALAASVLLVLGIGHELRHRAVTPLASHAPAHATTRPAATTGQDATLAQLQNHSMRLEKWLAELRTNGAPLQGGSLARAMVLQDRISLVDLQLTAPGTNTERQTLWTQRIHLLQDLAMLRASQSPIYGQHAMADTRDAPNQF